MDYCFQTCPPFCFQHMSSHMKSKPDVCCAAAEHIVVQWPIFLPLCATSPCTQRRGRGRKRQCFVQQPFLFILALLNPPSKGRVKSAPLPHHSCAVTPQLWLQPTSPPPPPPPSSLHWPLSSTPHRHTPGHYKLSRGECTNYKRDICSSAANTAMQRVSG